MTSLKLQKQTESLYAMIKCTTIGMMAISLIMAVGCAVSNEGAVDMRKTDRIFGTQKNNTQTQADDCLLHLHVKNFALGNTDSRLEKNDSISIHLRTAYIHTFNEFIIGNPLLIFTRSGLKPDGEIAIVANVFEEQSSKELDFKNMDSGRLVFYSNNVHQKQFLNFNNMPIYGPKRYDGAPIAFRISIMELDVQSEQMKAILDTLAKAGSTAYAPASPILNVLNSVGKTLADGKQNDTEFRYAMVLDPRGGSSRINHFTLEVGNYVFIRKENRSEPIHWDELVLDENEGRLYKKIEIDGVVKKGQLYKDESYLVVEINKNTSSKQIDLDQNSYGDLLESLKKADKAVADRISGADDRIQNELKKIAQIRAKVLNFNTGKELIHLIQTETNLIEKQVYSETLLKLIGPSLDEKGRFNEEKATITNEQVDYLLRKLRQSSTNLDIRRKDVGAANNDSIKQKELIEKITQ